VDVVGVVLRLRGGCALPATSLPVLGGLVAPRTGGQTATSDDVYQLKTRDHTGAEE